MIRSSRRLPPFLAQPGRHPFAALVYGAVLVLLATALSVPVRAAAPEPDSPELAAPGPYRAGLINRQLTQDALDPFAAMRQGHAVRAVRQLDLLIWYPARAAANAPTVTYSAALTGEPPLPPTRFTMPGTAVAKARAAGTGFPVVVISHGYDNDPAMMSWLGENLATKGYVVVAMAHRDPPITDRRWLAPSLLRRPLDVGIVLGALRKGLLGPLADTSRIAMVGYSFGGYTALTVGGARIDPAGPLARELPGDLIADYTGSGAHASELMDAGVQAVVAIAPAGGAPMSAWGTGLAALRKPLLVIAGSLDRTVGYDPGPASIFASATGSNRTLLTFVEAGHTIGTNPLPAGMRARLWDMDWFEDPVWRKPRVNAISLHFITAFLGQHLKGETAMADYLAVPSERSDGAGWTGPPTPYAAVSQGGTNPHWKGFIRNHQSGLILRHLPAAP